MSKPTKLQRATEEIYRNAHENGLVKRGLVRDGDMLYFGSFELSDVGILSDRGATIEEWTELVRILASVSQSAQWIIGDLLVYGERTWKKTYQDVMAITNLEYATLRTYAHVARKVDLSIRINKLSFAHHQLVTSRQSEEQREWLQKALANNWSISQLRDAIKGRSPTPSGPVGRFQDFVERNRFRYNTFLKRWERLGRGEKSQISQLIDAEIEYLEQLKERLE